MSRLYLNVFLLVSSLPLPAPSLGQDATEPDGPQRPDLREEVLRRVDRDQSVRRELMGRTQSDGRVASADGTAPARPDDDLLERLRDIDAENRRWLKRIVARHGWPGKSLFGADGAHAAWLLVQHADADVPFQKECLQLMDRAPAGEVAIEDVAYLTDRVRLGEGRPQLYGTQLEFRRGVLVPRPIEDEDRVDDRRSRLGLCPLAEYVDAARKVLISSDLRDPLPTDSESAR
jgi:hypothetical protein